MKTEVRKSPTVAASAPPERPPARRSRSARSPRSTARTTTRTPPAAFTIGCATPGWTKTTQLVTAVVTDATGAMVGLFQLTPALNTPAFRAGLRRALRRAGLACPHTPESPPLTLVSDAASGGGPADGAGPAAESPAAAPGPPPSARRPRLVRSASEDRPR